MHLFFSLAEYPTSPLFLSAFFIWNEINCVLYGSGVPIILKSDHSIATTLAQSTNTSVKTTTSPPKWSAGFRTQHREVLRATSEGPLPLWWIPTAGSWSWSTRPSMTQALAPSGLPLNPLVYIHSGSLCTVDSSAQNALPCSSPYRCMTVSFSVTEQMPSPQRGPP